MKHHDPEVIRLKTKHINRMNYIVLAIFGLVALTTLLAGGSPFLLYVFVFLIALNLLIRLLLI